MPPLFILFDEGAAAVFSTGTVFVVGVIRLTLSGSYQRSSPRFVIRAAAECLLLDDAQRACSLGRPLIAILFALVQAWRAAAADHSALEVIKAAAQQRWCSDTLGRFGTARSRPAAAWSVRDADSLLEGGGFKHPVPPPIFNSFEVWSELEPIAPRRGGTIRSEAFEEPPLTLNEAA